MEASARCVRCKLRFTVMKYSSQVAILSKQTLSLPGPTSATDIPRGGRAGDGMDAEMDDPELMFELAEHLGECQCACDHVVYSPSYTACLQVGQVFRTRSNNLDDCL
jgi:hypothetical protein